MNLSSERFGGDDYFDFQSLRQSSEKFEEWTLRENDLVDTEMFCSHRAVNTIH